jgi:hypothetical protein
VLAKADCINTHANWTKRERACAYASIAGKLCAGRSLRGMPHCANITMRQLPMLEVLASIAQGFIQELSEKSAVILRRGKNAMPLLRSVRKKSERGRLSLCSRYGNHKTRRHTGEKLDW